MIRVLTAVLTVDDHALLRSGIPASVENQWDMNRTSPGAAAGREHGKIVLMARRAGMTVIALLASCGIASALNPSVNIDQYAHTSWTVRQGFFKGRVHTIAQTPDGYLWLGTEFGLLRFDGIRSIPWQPPAHQQLPGEYVGKLLTSRDGTLWIGTQEGLASWKDGKLTTYPALAGLEVLGLV